MLLLAAPALAAAALIGLVPALPPARWIPRLRIRRFRLSGVAPLAWALDATAARGLSPPPVPRSRRSAGATGVHAGRGPRYGPLGSDAHVHPAPPMTDVPNPTMAVPSRLGVTARFEDGELLLDLAPRPEVLHHGVVRASVISYLVDAGPGSRSTGTPACGP